MIDAGLAALLAAAGPSGHEDAPVRAWCDRARELGLRVEVDALGSATARLGDPDAPRRLVLVGHIDEIGLIVTHIDDDGFLWFRSIGGWDPLILVGQRVRVLGADGPVVGAIGRKPIHLQHDDEDKSAPKLRDLHIDVAARDGAEARASVRVGDVAVIDAEPVQMRDDRLMSRALDNRLGAHVALQALAGGEPVDGWEVIAVAAVQEEITSAGATTVAHALDPTVAVAIDVTHATDTPGADAKESGEHALGSGVVLERGAIVHPRVYELLERTATEESIPFTIEASGRHTGTDADALHLSRSGVPTGLVSIPLRYVHSPVEMVCLDDVAATARLLSAFARRLPGADLTRA